jgi:hypothetical protein
MRPETLNFWVIKNAVFWDVAPRRTCVNRRSRWTYRLHLQGRKIRERGTSVSRWQRMFLSWRWRRYVPPKRRFTQDLHGATSQKTALFIVTAVKTSNLTLRVIVERMLVLYMHDGAPPHFSRAVRDVPSDTYHARWIGKGGPITWLPHSLDLNYLDFYMWGHLNILVCAAPVDNEETHHHRIVDACRTTRNCPGIFERMWRSMMMCVKACIESHGGHFEHLL